MSKFKNIAVLIDADNIGSSKIDWVFTQIQTLGTITTKRIYGDFAKSHLSSWEGAILKYAIEKKHQTSYSTGKNSSDIALAIDAMDLLYTNQCDAFCIISSDSDFIGLALRLRRTTIQVFGFGDNKTIKEFRQVCSQFFEIGNNNQSKSNTTTNPPKNTTTKSISTIKKFTENELKCDTKLLNALRESVEKSLKNDWANYSQINTYLQKNYPQLKPNQYGYEKWSEILLMIDLFEHKKMNSGIFFCIKNKKSNSSQIITKQTVSQLKKDAVLIEVISKSIESCLIDGWANYGQLNSYLNQNYPDLSPKKYGYSKWRTLIEQLDLFEVRVENSSVFLRTKMNTASKKIINQALLDDILQIINENTARTDEWLHIGYLGSQLKNKGYEPKDLGFKSFTELLKNVSGVTFKQERSTMYFTLLDKSDIKQNSSLKPITESSNQNFEETNFYKLLVHNQTQINNKIKGLLDNGTQLKFYDIWRMIHNNLPNHVILSDKESWQCFIYFFQRNLTLFCLKSENDILYITHR